MHRALISFASLNYWLLLLSVFYEKKSNIKTHNYPLKDSAFSGLFILWGRLLTQHRYAP